MTDTPKYFESWVKCCRWLKKQIIAASPIAGPGIAVTETPKGTRISLTGATGGGGSNSSGATAIPARIDSGDAASGFAVTLYANGLDKAYTGAATGVKALDMALADSACVGEYVYVFTGTITVTGGTE